MCKRIAKIAVFYLNCNRVVKIAAAENQKQRL